MLKLFVFLAAVLCVRSNPKDPLHPTIQDYCDINITNTPCKYKCVRDDALCGPKYPHKYKQFTREERRFALHRHNTLRNDFAGGAYKGFPQAADMMVLSWDKECEWMTACYILQCTWAHDETRRPVQARWPQGQNLYRRRKKSDTLYFRQSFANDSMNAWFDEYKLVTPEHVEMMTTGYARVKEVMIGHFTQFVWAVTQYVGCAQYRYHAEDTYHQVFFCNYYPLGNFNKRKVFTPGKPASKCPEGTKRNSRYPNLCGTIRNYADDKFVPPIDLDPEGTEREKKRLLDVKKGLIKEDPKDYEDMGSRGVGRTSAGVEGLVLVFFLLLAIIF